MRRDTIFYQLFLQSPTLLFDLIPDRPDNADEYVFDSILRGEATPTKSKKHHSELMAYLCHPIDLG
jgi:predicted transposase YdaD